MSRHVLFDESQFPGSTKLQHTKSSSSLSLVVPPSVSLTNSLEHPSMVPIPLPRVFVSAFPPTTSHVTQSTTLNQGDLVSISPAISSSTSDSSTGSVSGSSMGSDLHPDTTTSQATELQLVPLQSQNFHPKQKRSKSGISKKKQVFHTTIHSDSIKEPQSYTAASKSPQWKIAM